MAQITDTISGAEFQLETSDDGVTWVDHSSSAIAVTHTGEDTVIGSQNTAEGDAPVVTGGNKHGPAQIEVRFVYTKETSKLWDVLRDAWEGTKRLYLRWAPEGGIGTVVGNEQFMAASDAGTAFPCRFAGAPLVPNVDVGAGGPAVSMARFTCPKVVRSLTTTS